MINRKNQSSPYFSRGQNAGRDYGHGGDYRRDDNENGVDARAYGNYRNNYRPSGEYDYENEGYNGRNASDYENERYTGSYYYSPSDHQYNYNNDRQDYDRDYNRLYENRAGRDYFEPGDSRDYYGSYPSYGQSYPSNNEYRGERFDHDNERRYRNRADDFTLRSRDIGREPLYNRSRNERNDDDRYRRSIRNRWY